jgi:hypothetical protein
MTLAISLSPDTESKLSERARAAGMDVPTYAARLLERDVRRPTLLQISGDIAERFRASGMTEEELGEILEREKHAAREARRGKPFSE